MGESTARVSDLCAPATAAVPQPVVAAPAAACQAAEALDQPITSAEVESALPLLNNNRSGAGQGWPAELLRYAYREVQDEDGKTLKFLVLARLARPLAAMLDAAFQRGVLPDDVKSSLVTPVFKKGDKRDPANYRPIAVGEPLCRLYAAILNRRIVSWAEEAGLRAPCQAGFRPRMSTEHQLFALRHFIDRSRFQKQPLFAAFVDLRKAYDNVQHPLLWASLQRKGVHGKMLAAIQSLYSGGAMSMKICGRAGATGTAQVGVRQGCPLSPTLFGLFFDDLYSQLQSDCPSSPSAGVECRGTRIPSLFHADDVALFSASAQGLQQLLDSMKSFCAANGLTISIPKTEIVVFGGGHHDCVWKVAGQHLKRSKSFTYLGMLFHEDSKIKPASARLAPSVGSIFSRYSQLQCANSVQLLVKLQQAILQPYASYFCKVWAPADAAIVPLRDLRSLQHTFLRRACRVKSSIPIEVVFQELSVTPRHDFWWRQVFSVWNAMAQADSESMINIVLHDAIAIAHNGCSYGWAAQVFKCFAEHGKSSPLVAGTPVEVQPDELQLSLQMQRQAAFDAVLLDPRSCPGPGVKLCTYRRCFSRRCSCRSQR